MKKITLKQRGEALHKAICDGVYPPNKRGTKELRRWVKQVVASLNGKLDLIPTDDVTVWNDGKLIIRFPEDKRRINAAMKANAIHTFFSQHPRLKK